MRQRKSQSLCYSSSLFDFNQRYNEDQTRGPYCGADHFVAERSGTNHRCVNYVTRNADGLPLTVLQSIFECCTAQ